MVSILFKHRLHLGYRQMTTTVGFIFELVLRATKTSNSNLVSVKYFSVTSQQFIPSKLGTADLNADCRLYIREIMLENTVNTFSYLLGHVWRFEKSRMPCPPNSGVVINYFPQIPASFSNCQRLF